MNNRHHFLDWISKLGIASGMDRLEIARVVILNRLNFAGASVAIVVGFKDLLLKGSELTVLPFIFLFFIGELLLAYFQRHTVARYAANILLPLLMTAVLMLYGPSNGAGYTLFVFITTAIIFHKEWVTRITLVVFIILLFSGSSIALLTFTPPLAARVDPLDAIITFIGTSVSVSLMITYFFQENQKHREEQARLLTSLERSNAELERFAYIASHDLKTPVRNISSFLGLVERDVKKGDYNNLEEFLGYAKEGAHQANALIEDILKFSKLNHDKPLDLKPTDLNTVVSNCASQLQGSYGDHFMLIASDLPVIYTAPNLLTILFMNLMDNAIKYNNSSQPTIEITVKSSPAEWLIIFSDNGIGIAPEFQEKVFEMFQRLHTTREYEGTGIGLAMCKKVAHRLGGNIQLLSQPGGGSRFSVQLPRQDYLT